jgi:hypothetical protein
MLRFEFTAASLPDKRNIFIFMSGKDAVETTTIFVALYLRVGMDWIGLAQDRDQWRALVNTAINLWVP